jgi:hypothetical protein
MDQMSNETAAERQLIADLSDELFDGATVPLDLASLWLAQERDDTDLLDAFELVLIAGLDTDEIVQPFADDTASDPAAVAALKRCLAEIRFVAEAMDGLLLGYWTPPGSEEAVVVSFDANGQLVVQGRTFAEALLALTDPDDSEEGIEVVDALRAYGIVMEHDTVAEVLLAIANTPDPNEVVLGYILEEKLMNSSQTKRS